MGKKKVIQSVKRIKIYTMGYAGYLDEMPEELKAIREARKAAKLFEVKQ